MSFCISIHFGLIIVLVNYHWKSQKFPKKFCFDVKRKISYRVSDDVSFRQKISHNITRSWKKITNCINVSFKTSVCGDFMNQKINFYQNFYHWSYLDKALCSVKGHLQSNKHAWNSIVSVSNTCETVVFAPVIVRSGVILHESHVQIKQVLEKLASLCVRIIFIQPSRSASITKASHSNFSFRAKYSVPD